MVHRRVRRRELKRDGTAYVMVDASRELLLSIENCDIDEGRPKSKTRCVIARALMAQLPLISRAEVGATVTYTFFPPTNGMVQGFAYRYKTPPDLRTALNHFDMTGEWDLPAGERYKLLKPPARPLGSRKDNLTPAGLASSAKRKLRPSRTGKRTLRHINPRLLEFRATGI